MCPSTIFVLGGCMEGQRKWGNLAYFFFRGVRSKPTELGFSLASSSRKSMCKAAR